MRGVVSLYRKIGSEFALLTGLGRSIHQRVRMELNKGLKECWPGLLREGRAELVSKVRHQLPWKVLERSSAPYLAY